MSFRDYSIRDLLLVVIVVGMLGLIAELLLMEHTESWQQWIPLIALATGLIAVTLARVRPSGGMLRFMEGVMGGFVLAGGLGVYFHFAGNVEFALERTPESTGLELVWKSLTGATPALAPGALAQLGLLGLVYAYRHPAKSTGSHASQMEK